MTDIEILRQSFEFMDIPEPTDRIAVLKHLERIGRTCYQSQDKITDESCIKFIENLKKRKHWAMLEHYIFTFSVPKNLYYELSTMGSLSLDHYDLTSKMPFIKMSSFPNQEDKAYFGEDMYLVSASATALNYLWACSYNKWDGSESPIVKLCVFLKEQFPELMMDPVTNRDKFPHSRIRLISREEMKTFPTNIRRIHDFRTVKFITNRGITHELVRHRPCSWAQESTRYVNANNFKVVYPCFNENEKPEMYKEWLEAMSDAQHHYQAMMNMGAKPQEAREVLPNSIKAEIVMTCNLEEMHHFLDMRTDMGAHPAMQELTKPLLKVMVEQEPEIFGDLSHRLDGDV